jgi:hypothetical protein
VCVSDVVASLLRLDIQESVFKGANGTFHARHVTSNAVARDDSSTLSSLCETQKDAGNLCKKELTDQ